MPCTRMPSSGSISTLLHPFYGEPGAGIERNFTAERDDAETREKFSGFVLPRARHTKECQGFRRFAAGPLEAHEHALSHQVGPSVVDHIHNDRKLAHTALGEKQRRQRCNLFWSRIAA